MVDFISEVQEELRKDDYNRWLKKYGPLIFAIIMAIILGTAFLEWKKTKDAKVAEKLSFSYLEASKIAGDNPEKSIQNFIDLSAQAPAGYAGLSLVRAAELELKRSNVQNAVNLLDSAAEKFEDKRHGQLAQMKVGYILAGQGNYADVIARMTPLSEKDEPYEYLARELLAFAAKETGDDQTARKHFSYLDTIPGVPETIKARAQQNIMMMNLKSSQEQEEASSVVDTPAEEAPEPQETVTNEE